MCPWVCRPLRVYTEEDVVRVTTNRRRLTTENLFLVYLAKPLPLFLFLYYFFFFRWNRGKFTVFFYSAFSETTFIVSSSFVLTTHSEDPGWEGTWPGEESDPPRSDGDGGEWEVLRWRRRRSLTFCQEPFGRWFPSLALICFLFLYSPFLEKGTVDRWRSRSCHRYFGCLPSE